MGSLRTVTALLVMTCALGGCSGSAAAGPRFVVAAHTRHRPAPFTLYAGSADLRHITVAIDACLVVGHVEVRNSGSREVVTIYAAPAEHCTTGRHTAHHHVALTQQYGCTREIIDGATGKGPRFAPDAREQDFTFSCPASTSR